MITEKEYQEAQELVWDYEEQIEGTDKDKSAVSEEIKSICRILKYIDNKHPEVMNLNTKEGRENVNVINSMIV